MTHEFMNKAESYQVESSQIAIHTGASKLSKPYNNARGKYRTNQNNSGEYSRNQNERKVLNAHKPKNGFSDVSEWIIHHGNDQISRTFVT